MTSFKTLAAALALPAALAAGAVSAGNTGQSKAHVHYVDLSLASEEGRAIFERRIDRGRARSHGCRDQAPPAQRHCRSHTGHRPGDRKLLNQAVRARRRQDDHADLSIDRMAGVPRLRRALTLLRD